ncbi:solute carrier family 12 [Trichuris trichiura]|uniref:Solute carrier family 12 n=1 Tax=Trichuris trichiura TaxID=36087 RepID=A0A077Z4B0_TRITR|nr:solute carrier family 12 [Trichuris trichiura]
MKNQPADDDIDEILDELPKDTIMFNEDSDLPESPVASPSVLVTRTKSMDMEMQVPNIKLYQTELLKTCSSRPSLTDLHENVEYVDIEEPPEPGDGNIFEEPVGSDANHPVNAVGAFKPPDAKVKFGWIRGVLIRCILNILGATLYLRLGWVAGHAGIALGTVIVLFSTLITTLTALSMCALCTNGEIKGGGAYFMLSRSLGPEFGGSMGMIFGLADATYAAMNVIGFAETISSFLTQADLSIVDGGVNDIRIIGACTQLCLFVLVMISVAWESKTELALFFIITISYITFLVGTFLPPSKEQMAQGITGYRWTTFSENMLPLWSGETIFSVFGIYLPSVTGIMAGAGISGDLAEPNKSIPKGTLLGIAVTTVLYLSGIWLTGATCIRNASGSLDDLYNGTIAACAENSTCHHGLLNSNDVMQLEGAFSPLVTAGIFATCLSSSLTCLVSAPRTFQAICRDRLYPYISFLGKGSGAQDEPRRATVLVTLVGLMVISIGELNSVAPLISNLYLASFALINYACFDGSLAQSPGWRPAFKYYNMWLSLLGALLCIAAMFILSWGMALVTAAVISTLYVYLLHRKPNVNWGSSGQAYTYTRALRDMVTLLTTEEHVKNYRPQVLVFTGNPVSRPCLIDFVRSITKDVSLMVCGHVITLSNPSDLCGGMASWTNRIHGWLHRRKVKAFYAPVVVENYFSGIEMLLQLSGFGKLTPNIAFMGYKSDWRTCAVEDLKNYMNTIHECFSHDMAVCILRLSSGCDFSDLLKKYPFFDGCDLLDPVAFKAAERARRLEQAKITLGKHLATVNELAMEVKEEARDGEFQKEAKAAIKRIMNSVALFTKEKTPKRPVTSKRSIAAKGLSIAVNQFRRKRKHAVIDVWWFSDDGGLTLLVSHLLSQSKSYLEGAQLRVFTKAQDVNNLMEEEESLKALLAKFRISYTDVIVLPDMLSLPNDVTVRRFDQLTAPFLRTESELKLENEKDDVFITPSQKENLKRRINRHLLTHELLQRYSKETTLIVISLPVPRKGRESAYLFLSFLEIITRDLPPVLLVRGNQKNVLTFYS